MLKVLICKVCGKIYNPETFSGLKCEICGGKLQETTQEKLKLTDCNMDYVLWEKDKPPK